jgi:hypothetical protein
MSTLVSPTLAKLVSNVRRLLNQPSASNSFWADDELADYINEGIRRYFLEVTFNNEGQFTTNTVLDLVAGTENISLPSDCFEVRAVYRIDNDQNIALRYINDFTHSYTTTGADSGGYYPDYSFQGNSLVLRPKPNFSEVGGLHIDYIQFPDMLATAGDRMTAQVLPLFKELVEMYAVYKAKMRESLVNGVDMTGLAKENLAALYTQFKEAIKNRSQYPQYVEAFNPEGN